MKRPLTSQPWIYFTAMGCFKKIVSLLTAKVLLAFQNTTVLSAIWRLWRSDITPPLLAIRHSSEEAGGSVHFEATSPCSRNFWDLNGPISRDNAIVSLRYPLSRDTFSAIPAIPQQGAIPPPGALFYTDISVWHPILQRIARYLCDTPRKTSTEEFCETIAESIARYEKYRCWAS